MLIIYLARVLEPSDVGLYGVMVASVAAMIYFLGFGFDVYGKREIIMRSLPEKAECIVNTITFFCFSYAVFLPFALVLFLLHIIPFSELGYFYTLVILEHLLQESDRLLITLDRQIWGNFIYCIRSGLWCFLLFLVAYLLNGKLGLSLNVVWDFWICFDCIALLLVTIMLKCFLPWSHIKNYRIDWGWIKRGLKPASIFFFISISLPLTILIQRAVIVHFFGYQLAGVYSIYSTILNVVSTFTYIGIFSFGLQNLIRCYHSKNILGWHKEERELWVSTGGFLLLALPIVTTFAYFILRFWISNPIYIDNIDIFYIMIVATAITVLANLFYYKIYALQADVVLLLINLVSLLLMLVLTFLGAYFLGVLGVALAYAGYALFNLVCRVCFYFKLKLLFVQS